MLTAIEGEHLYWDCLLYDRTDGELTSCGQGKRAHLSEVRYLTPDMVPNRQARGIQRLLPARLRTSKSVMPTSGQGAVIALPRCACGVQTFLKADYSVKEAWQCVYAVKNDNEGDVWAYAMKPQHARNLVAHWLLYERGLAPVAPVLPMPPREAIADAGIDTDSFTAIWFGWLAYREYGGPRLGAPTVLPLLQLQTGHEIRKEHETWQA